ncbi:MAG: sterol desaturase family protein [Silvanigrellaceae bacterium]|nr:sterol desaturase family protein [Silvanigrellaceae bacterium]
MQYILIFTVPIYLIAILLEILKFKPKLSQTYKLKDTLASLSMGLGYLFVSSICGLYIYYIFSFLYKNRLFEIPNVWVALFNGDKIYIWGFILLIFLEDFCYYWFHRMSHICRFFWCAHETHHSSEYYNFGTALRQSWIGAPFTWIFWAPLAFIGFKPEDIIFQSSLNLFYQFWVHTKLTKSFGIFDHILNTPSHHRVHHGTNIPYLDKNYAGIFIIWDKIFKTFIPETSVPNYGVLHPVNSFNPVKIAFHMLGDLYLDIKNTKKIKDKFCYLIYPPGWKPDHKGLTSKQMQDEYYKNKSFGKT